jgi:hypothetical protein
MQAALAPLPPLRHTVLHCAADIWMYVRPLSVSWIRVR